MKMLSKYKAVFFDVGGTLLRVHPSVGDIYATHARPFGFSGSAADLDALFRSQWKENGGIESLGNRGGLEVEKKFWRDLVFQVFESCGGLDDFENYFAMIYEVFERKESFRVFEDVIESEILEQLKSRGIVLGVISNWDSRLRATLENQGLARHFDFILASTEVRSAKPDKKIFSEALRLSGAKENETCHIGDEIDADFLGARNMGMDSILVDRKNLHAEKAAPRIRSFLELV